MAHSFRAMRWLGAIALVVFTLSAAGVRADDPPPQDPTLKTTGSTTTGPTVASVEAWEDALAVIESVYPGIDYATATAYALEWFNLLPPEEYTPPADEPPPPPAEEPPADDPPPADEPPPEELPVARPATQEEWDAAAAFIRDYFYPDIDDATLAITILEWFLLLPPE